MGSGRREDGPPSAPITAPKVVLLQMPWLTITKTDTLWPYGLRALQK